MIETWLNPACSTSRTTVLGRDEVSLVRVIATGRS
ncbi:unannotated protein [freshwater metagenome]|uniref:Unannotated protein n=1 Tax=freshwater metagenome TaxID=449393 RepID=A0A6J6RZR0_9ZZZZ